MSLPELVPQYPYPEGDQYTEDEYFALEDATPTRWEFLPDGAFDPDGRRLGIVRAMSGGTRDHSGVACNLIGGLIAAFRGTGNSSCRVFNSDLKVHCADGRNTYPDVSVVCGPPVSYFNRFDIVTNPVLAAEALSPSSAGDDQGPKRKSYQSIPSLKYYLLLAVDRVNVQMYSRTESGWQLEAWDTLEDEIALPDLGVTLSLADLYYLVDFEEGPL